MKYVNDNSNNTLYIELNFKNANNSFPNEAAEFFFTFSWAISKISSIEQLGHSLFWFYFPLVFDNV